MSSYFRQQLEEWVGTIDVKADSVLDVGGGAKPVKDRVNSWDVQEYKILDNKLEGEFHADIIGDLNVPECDKPGKKENDWLNKKFLEEKDCFNVAFCLEVFEYIWNPVTALNNINYLLEKGGALYISFPFIYPNHAPEGHDYLRYTKFGVKKLLSETGFEIDYIKSRIATRGACNLLEFIAEEKMHPLKGYRGHDEIGFLVKAHKK